MKTLKIDLKQLGLASAILAILAISAATAHADGSVRFNTIDYPGATQTFAWGINAAGDIVGSYKTTASDEHGFVLRNGVFTSFDYPGAAWTQAWGISARGDIVGQYGLPGGNTIHGFLLRKGTFIPIDVPAQQNTMLVKISSEGTIAGCYHSSNGGVIDTNSMYGFEMSAAGVITSHPLARTMNNGINPRGEVVGWYSDPATARALWSYILNNGELTWFQFEGSVVTQAWDISPTGTVVGFHRSSLSGPLPQFHGFTMEQGVMTSIDVPGATATRAYGINAEGDIVGYYTTGVGASAINHGFLLTQRESE